MKTLRKTLFKGVVIVTLFTTVSVGLSTTGIKTVNEANAAVSYQQVYSYLINTGHQVVTLSPYGQKNWTSHTIINGVHYTTFVQTDGTNIVGHMDIPI
jgi:hypothetical protein